jgi:GNAT superfamily N-acetyltransferase
MYPNNIAQSAIDNAQLPRKLEVTDLDAILALQREVNTDLPAGFVRFKDESQLLAYLNGELGAAFGLFDGRALLAIALLRIPSLDHPHQLEPLPRILPKEDWSLHTAVYESAMVAPHARGRGYQRMLLDACVVHAKAVGMRWVGGGSRLDNVLSWRNMLVNGMTIVGVRIHQGQAFVGLLQSIEREDALDTSFTDFRLVSAKDAVEHMRALDAGYLGTALTPFDAVIYQRCLP